jgi:hypothetical protein
MPIRRSNRFIECFEQATLEEAAVNAHGHGRPAGHGCGHARQAPVPTVGPERGRTPTAEAAPHPVGQAPVEDEDEEEVDEEIEAVPAPQQRRGG